MIYGSLHVRLSLGVQLDADGIRSFTALIKPLMLHSQSSFHQPQTLKIYSHRSSALKHQQRFINILAINITKLMQSQKTQYSIQNNSDPPKPGILSSSKAFAHKRKDSLDPLGNSRAETPAPDPDPKRSKISQAVI
jgi:hypothetical protein